MDAGGWNPMGSEVRQKYERKQRYPRAGVAMGEGDWIHSGNTCVFNSAPRRTP